MQSGSALTKDWVLDFEPELPTRIDPLMGWSGSSDMASQVRLTFETKEEAVAYAERNGIAYSVIEPAPHKRHNKSYSDNFKFGRIGAWSH
jgi:hypothetical protein